MLVKVREHVSIRGRVSVSIGENTFVLNKLGGLRFVLDSLRECDSEKSISSAHISHPVKRMQLLQFSNSTNL